MRPRAGIVSWGAAGSNACPAGSYVIVDEAQCQAAAATTRKDWRGGESLPGMPRGCYWYTSTSNVYLNAHATGAAFQYAQPLCAVGTGPRTHA